MTRKQMRLTWIAAIGLVVAVALGLVLFALRSEISFAMSPTELHKTPVEPGQRIRLFGLVREGSVVRGDGLKVQFELTDNEETVTVKFENILPDLFREGQGIISEGVMGADGVFIADTVLAKHDENYMPKEVAEALKEKGVWQGNANER